MGIEARTDALRAHAAFCEGLATDLDAGEAPPTSANHFQPTTAAVAAVHGTVGAAALAMAERLRSTATAVHTTAAGFDEHESAAAAELRSLTE